jgi:hypothetical protein
MCQTLALRLSAERIAPNSWVNVVLCGVNPLPHGLSGPIGAATASTSSTVLACPSTAMSSRAENRCWWNGAPSPGASSEANGSGAALTVESPVWIATAIYAALLAFGYALFALRRRSIPDLADRVGVFDETVVGDMLADYNPWQVRR